ncbi:MAG: hypothetical protein JOY85_23760 [Acidobacteriaceae bacterium]|nr:hypothetical protein [Acidobacteriaceae bacterium]
MWAKTTIGVLLERPARSFSSHASCSAPSVPRPPGLQINDIDQADKVNSLVIEAVPPGTLGAFAVAL